MGNSNDSRIKFECGYLFVQSDKPFYFAGETITGNIFLNLSAPFPATHLDIEVRGKEKCKFLTHHTRTIRRNGKTRTQHYTVTRRGEKKLMHYRVPLFSFVNSIAQPGQYTFPFQFTLPDFCPASLYLAGHDSSRAKIKYHVKAIMEALPATNIAPMKYKQRIIVRQIVKSVTLN